jgi:hypothetical protein
MGAVLRRRRKLVSPGGIRGVLKISGRLAEQHPGSSWQRDLAVAHSRMGARLQAQEAGQAPGGIRKYLKISGRLASSILAQAGNGNWPWLTV